MHGWGCVWGGGVGQAAHSRAAASSSRTGASKTVKEKGPKAAVKSTSGPGRPSDSIETILEREVSLFQVADAGSVFFNDKSATKRNNLRRYIQKAEAQEKSGTPEEQAAGANAKHHFQMMDSVIKLHENYSRNSSDEKNLSNYMAEWARLTTFLQDKPNVLLECPFAWAEYYEVLSELPECANFAEELSKVRLLKRGVIKEESKAAAFQRERLADMLAAKVHPVGDAGAMATALGTRLAPLLEPEAATHLDAGLIAELRDIHTVLVLTPVESSDVFELLEGNIRKVKDGGEAVGKTMLGTFCKFKQAGLAMIGRAELAASGFAKTRSSCPAWRRRRSSSRRSSRASILRVMSSTRSWKLSSG